MAATAAFAAAAAGDCAACAAAAAACAAATCICLCDNISIMAMQSRSLVWLLYYCMNIMVLWVCALSLISGV